MADTKISALTELAELPAATDELVLVDKSDTSMAGTGTDKRILFSNLIGGSLASNLATGANALRSARSSSLSAPATSASTSGGLLASATYFYVYTALDADGNETAKSSEASVAVTGPTGLVTLSWTAVPGAYAYRLYRGTSTGAQDRYITVRDAWAVRDYGAPGDETTGTPPSSGTFYDSSLKREGAGWFSGKRVHVIQDFADSNTNISSGIQSYITAKQSGRVFDGHAAVRATARDRSDVTEKTVSGATNASPIEITATSHGYATGDKVTVWGVGGNTAANGLWRITNTGANTFTLDGSTGNGAYTSGGSASNRGLLYAGMFLIEPSQDRDEFTANVNGEDAVGVCITNNGSARATEALYIGTNGNMATAFQHGIAVDAPAINGIRLGGGRTFTTGINGSSATYTDAINFASATITGDALDFSSSTLSGSLLKGPKSSILIGASAAQLNGASGLAVRTDDGTVPEVFIDAQTSAGVAAALAMRGRAGSANVRLEMFAGGGTNGRLGTETAHDLLIYTGGSANTRLTIGASGGFTIADAQNIAVGTTTGTKIGTATTQKIGFFNATPIVQPSAYTVTNVTTDRSYNANSYTNDEIADVLGTLITDLKALGLIG